MATLVTRDRLAQRPLVLPFAVASSLSVLLELLGLSVNNKEVTTLLFTLPVASVWWEF